MRTTPCHGFGEGHAPQKNELPRGNEDLWGRQGSDRTAPQKNELPRGNEDIGKNAVAPARVSPQKNELPRGNEDDSRERIRIIFRPPKE